MHIVVDYALFLLAIFFGIVWFSVIALPLLYGVPRSTWWALRGRLKWRAIPAYLVSPIVWSFIFVGAAMLLEHFTPNVVRYLYSSAAFFWGQWFGIILSAVRTVGAASARKALNEDFLDFVGRFLTARGRDLVPVAPASILAPDRLNDIVNAYGAVLAKPSELGELGVVRDVRSLPYTKKDIKIALVAALKVTAEDDLKEHLKVGYISLADFQPLSVQELRALQLWNSALAKGETGVELDDVFKTVADEGNLVTVVLKRVTDEANSLVRELEALGFWRQASTIGEGEFA